MSTIQRRIFGIALFASFGLFSPGVFAFAPGGASLQGEYRTKIRPRKVISMPAMTETERATMERADPSAQKLLRQHPLWKLTFDARNGRVDSAFGDGHPWFPGAGMGNHLQWGDFGRPELAAGLSPKVDDVLPIVESAARKFMADYPDLVGSWRPDQLELVKGLASFEKSDEPFWIAFRVSSRGIPILESDITFAINHGNMVSVNVRAIGPVDELRREKFGESESLGALASYLGLPAKALRTTRPSQLAFAPEECSRDESPSGLVNRMVWVLWVADDHSNEWENEWYARVDAETGEVRVFESAYSSACILSPTQRRGRVTGGVRPARAFDPEVIRPLPYANVTDNAVAKNADYNGWFPTYSGNTSSSTLNGPYMRMACSGCDSQPTAQDNNDGTLNFGTGGVDSTTNQWANSLGTLNRSTPADRTAYYHLNYARDLIAKWSPITFGLQTVNVNVNATCNANSNGGTVLNFYRSGGGCANTGEIRDVMQHELGHTWDGTDATGNNNADGTGEHRGDGIALFVDRDSCIGQSFGTVASNNCDGVRDIDEWAPGGRGRLVRADATGAICASEVHCQGEVPGQALWHFQQALLTGKDYNNSSPGLRNPLPGANPAFSVEQAFWIGERLFFKSAPVVATWNPTTTGKSLYEGYTETDDDDGNLANGVPHGDYINNAFIHHDIQEATSRGDTANCAAIADPVVTFSLVTDGTNGLSGVKLDWTSIAGIDNYVIYRVFATGDGYLPIATVSNATLTYTDADVQPGLTFYYYVAAVKTTACAGTSPGLNVVTVPINLPTFGVGSFSLDDVAGGNGNGQANPGETVKVYLRINELVGSTGSNGPVSVSISTTQAGVTVTRPGPYSYGTFNPGQSKAALNGQYFEFSLTAGFTCATGVPFSVTMTGLLPGGGSGCWLDSFRVVTCGAQLLKPDIQVYAWSVVSDSLGTCTDNDKYLDAGEIVRLKVDVVNKGTTTANAPTVSWSETSGKLTPVSPVSVVLTPLAETNGVLSSALFDVKVDGSTACGTATTFTFSATAAGQQASPSTKVASTRLEVNPNPQTGLTWTADFETLTGNNLWTNETPGGFDWTRVNACNHTPGGLYVYHFPTTVNCTANIAYGNNQDERIYSPLINLGANPPSPVDTYTLRSVNFWVLGSAEQGFDFDTVEISADGNVAGPWAQVFSHSVARPAWYNFVQDLSKFVVTSNNIRLRWRFLSDGSTSTANGWAIDDIVLTWDRNVSTCDTTTCATCTAPLVSANDALIQTNTKYDPDVRVTFPAVANATAYRVYYFTIPNPQPVDFASNYLGAPSSGPSFTASHRTELDPSSAEFVKNYYYVVASSCDGVNWIH